MSRCSISLLGTVFLIISLCTLSASIVPTHLYYTEKKYKLKSFTSQLTSILCIVRRQHTPLQQLPLWFFYKEPLCIVYMFFLYIVNLYLRIEIFVNLNSIFPKTLYVDIFIYLYKFWMCGLYTTYLYIM